jgi:hypothetical protein
MLCIRCNYFVAGVDSEEDTLRVGTGHLRRVARLLAA